jgi:cytochrome P450
MKEMAPYAIAQFRQRRDHPTDDILSAFANAEVDGELLSENALAGIFNLLIVAGNETTRNSFTAGLIALTEHPDQMDQLRRDADLIPGAIDEVLRWVSPVMHFRRTATKDITIRGQTIGAGEKVVIWDPSGNRDSDIFVHPDTFDITRPDAKKHIAFGRGPHMCIGQYVAKLQLKVMFEEILQRRPEIVSTGAAQYMRTNFVASIKRAPFRLAKQGSCPFAQQTGQVA